MDVFYIFVLLHRQTENVMKGHIDFDKSSPIYLLKLKVHIEVDRRKKTNGGFHLIEQHGYEIDITYAAHGCFKGMRRKSPVKKYCEFICFPTYLLVEKATNKNFSKNEKKKMIAGLMREHWQRYKIQKRVIGFLKRKVELGISLNVAIKESLITI